MSTQYKLKDVTALPATPGDKVEASIEGLDGAKVLLVNVGGHVSALGPKCTHYGAPMVKGVLTETGQILCPWHGACFNARTGDIEDAPARNPLPVFKVTEDNGSVYVTGDPTLLAAGSIDLKFNCPQADAPPSSGIVVVGGGSGAVGFVEGLRTSGHNEAVTVISNEGYLPIDRPKLSKALVGDPKKIQLRSQEWYDEANIKFVYDEVVSVDPKGKSVATKAGKSFSYTKLILAPGGTANRLPTTGLDGTLSNVFTLRSASDAAAITAAIGDKGKNIVVIGSSFIGLEIANTLCKDNTVSVIGPSAVPLSRILGPKVGAAIQEGLEGKGIKFYMRAKTKHALASEKSATTVGSVELDDGTSLPADLVILGVGVKPATGFLKDNSAFSLQEDGSLLTDGFYQVLGHQDIYAVGDIAKFPYLGPGTAGATRIEHWNVAQNAGRTAAQHIAGITGEEPSVRIPVFWSALSAQLRYCGNTAGGFDDVVIDGDLKKRAFAAYYTNGDTVVAVATMGKDPVMVDVAQKMARGKMESKTEIVGRLSS